MEIISEKIVTAKKEHVCDYCGLKIQIGEKYEDQVNVNDGDLYHWKSHLACKKLAEKLNMFSDYWYGEGLTGEGFHENVLSFLSEKGIEYHGWPDALEKTKTAAEV